MPNTFFCPQNDPAQLMSYFRALSLSNHKSRYDNFRQDLYAQDEFGRFNETHTFEAELMVL